MQITISFRVDYLNRSLRTVCRVNSDNCTRRSSKQPLQNKSVQCLFSKYLPYKLSVDKMSLPPREFKYVCANPWLLNNTVFPVSPEHERSENGMLKQVLATKSIFHYKKFRITHSKFWNANDINTTLQCVSNQQLGAEPLRSCQTHKQSRNIQ